MAVVIGKTNTGLVEYAIGQVGRPYWYGCYGQTASASLYISKKNQYPKYYTATDFAKQYGQKVHDCSGLVKGYLWCSGIDGKPSYSSTTDKSTSGLYAAAASSKKGEIKNMPSGVPGILVFKGSTTASINHVGIYDGIGTVYEAKGHEYGVQATDFNVADWNYYAYCAYVDYVENSVDNSVTYFAKAEYDGTSLVDALKSIGATSALAYRKQIAAANGMSSYSGTAKQNSTLLTLLKEGKLIKP